MPANLGEWLLKQNELTPQQLQNALDHQKERCGTLGRALLSLGFVADKQLTRLLSRFYNVPSIDLGAIKLDSAVVNLIPSHIARRHKVLPVAWDAKKTLSLAMADPWNLAAIDEIRFMTGHNVEPIVVSEQQLEQVIERYFGPVPVPGPPVPAGPQARASGAAAGAREGPGLSAEDVASIGGLGEIDFDSLADDEPESETARSEDEEIDLSQLAPGGVAPVVKLVNVMLVDSLKRRASAIHIEPYEREFRVRFRIDGVLYNVMALPMKLRDPLTTRLKLMAVLDLTEKRLPQVGHLRIRMKVADRSRDLAFRVSTWPTLWGETIVMRLLDEPQLVLDMTRLGFEVHSLERFRNAIARLSGIALVTGPRRSGKTRTLYSALASLNRPDIHIITAEDAPDLTLPGINQLQLERNSPKQPDR